MQRPWTFAPSATETTTWKKKTRLLLKPPWKNLSTHNLNQLSPHNPVSQRRASSLWDPLLHLQRRRWHSELLLLSVFKNKKKKRNLQRCRIGVLAVTRRWVWLGSDASVGVLSVGPTGTRRSMIVLLTSRGLDAMLLPSPTLWLRLIRWSRGSENMWNLGWWYTLYWVLFCCLIVIDNSRNRICLVCVWMEEFRFGFTF